MALVGDRPTVTDWCGFMLVLGGAALIVLGPQLLDTSPAAQRR